MFLAIAILPAGLAVWLAWRLLEQDRIIANDHVREIRERRADEVVQSLSRAIATVAQDSRSLPPGSVRPLDEPLAFAVHPQVLPEAAVATFSAGERAEFRAGGSQDAIGLYRALTGSPSVEIRAGAWLRMARTLRRLGKRADAIHAYRQLLEIQGAAAGGAPAPLAAQWAICTMHEEAGRLQELKQEGEALRRLLDVSRPALSRDVYEAYAEDASRWSGQPRPAVSEALAEAAGSRLSGAGAAMFRGQWISWVAIENRTVLLAPGYVARMLPSGPVRVRFAAYATPEESLRRAEETGLPWTLAIALTDPAREMTDLDTRRQLLFAIFGLVTALGTGGSYLGWRLIRRELALAQMQADILAAVSHEFRTPLTSMRQISAALSEGRVTGEARRQAYYDALSRATTRLHRLVEGMLDFSSMESEAMPYRMKSIDLTALVTRTVADFQKEVTDNGFTLHTEIPSAEIAVSGDAEALRRALWNLLENAVKYSGESLEAWVRLACSEKEATLSVEDHGIGIPHDEQREVFRKFFRGAAARAGSVRGSGIGLSMVRHIVEAHHGRVTLESRPGAGSTFAIHLLPEDRQGGANTDRRR